MTRRSLECACGVQVQPLYMLYARFMPLAVTSAVSVLEVRGSSSSLRHRRRLHGRGPLLLAAACRGPLTLARPPTAVPPTASSSPPKRLPPPFNVMGGRRRPKTVDYLKAQELGSASTATTLADPDEKVPKNFTQCAGGGARRHQGRWPPPPLPRQHPMWHEHTRSEAYTLSALEKLCRNCSSRRAGNVNLFPLVVVGYIAAVFCLVWCRWRAPSNPHTLCWRSLTAWTRRTGP